MVVPQVLTAMDRKTLIEQSGVHPAVDRAVRLQGVMSRQANRDRLSKVVLNSERRGCGVGRNSHLSVVTPTEYKRVRSLTGMSRPNTYILALGITTTGRTYRSRRMQCVDLEGSLSPGWAL